MANRNRTNSVQFYLSNDEQYILNTKFKASGMKSMSAFLRKLVLYEYVYDVDYSYLRNYNTELGRISSSLNQIAKRVNSTGNIYQDDMNEVKELMNEVWHTQKIHAIKATVDKAIDYICNPDKTDEQIYVSSYACAPETAAIDFKYTLDHCRENSPNKAYHLIQAFAPVEVSYEEAHRIGKELADKVLEWKYSYVLTTHIDKGHIHNHIIFCAADNIEHNKYHDCKQSYYHIRKLSDELCKAHNLSIIIPGGERGKKIQRMAV